MERACISGTYSASLWKIVNKSNYKTLANISKSLATNRYTYSNYFCTQSDTECHTSGTLSFLSVLSFFFLFWKPWNVKKKYDSTHKTYLTGVTVLHCCVSAEQRWKLVGIGYMWNESVCVMVLTMLRQTNGHGCLKPLCFSHPPAAGEKQLLLTLRSRLQILSILRILSLCEVNKKKVWLSFLCIS